MTKSELARAAGVSYATFARWLRDPEIKAKLAPFNLKKQQHILPSGAVEIICEHYVISSEPTIND